MELDLMAHLSKQHCSVNDFRVTRECLVKIGEYLLYALFHSHVFLRYPTSKWVQ